MNVYFRSLFIIFLIVMSLKLNWILIGIDLFSCGKKFFLYLLNNFLESVFFKMCFLFFRNKW